MPKKVTAFSLERETLKEIDDRRGLIPRSAYVQNILNNALKEAHNDNRNRTKSAIC